VTHSEERLREMLAESGIADEGSERLLECLSTLERSVDDTLPEPGPELAALMARAGAAVRTSVLSRRRGRVLVAGAVAFGTVAAGGIAAAANELPPDAQRLVAEFSERYLPFELPRPDVRPDGREEDELEQPVTTWQDQGDDVPPPVLPGSTPTTSAKSPEASPGTKPTPSPSALTAPTSSVLPEPEQVDPTGEPSPAPDQEPTGDGGDGGSATDGDPQAGPDGGVTQSPDTGDSTGTEVVPAPSGGPSPSGSSEPDPIVSSRTEPSSTASP
jgi:hypothetical protein